MHCYILIVLPDCEQDIEGSFPAHLVYTLSKRRIIGRTGRHLRDTLELNIMSVYAKQKIYSKYMVK